MTRLFDHAQIFKCLDLLGKARASLQRCGNSNTYPEFYSSWGDILIQGSGILHAIEAGCQKTPQAKQWYYGSVMRECRSDQLIRYMYQARNEQEHGSNPVTGQIPLPIALRHEETGSFESILNIDNIEREKYRIAIGSFGSVPTLIPVVDSKHKTVFPPPSEHRGKPLVANHPLAVADLYLVFLEDLIRRAAERS